MVDGSHSQAFTVQLTVPFACPKDTTCPLILNMFIPKDPTTAACEVSSLKKLPKNKHHPCGLEFYPEDVNKPKNMTVMNQIGNRAISAAASIQEYEIFLQTIPMTTHEMFGDYMIDSIRVCMRAFKAHSLRLSHCLELMLYNNMKNLFRWHRRRSVCPLTWGETRVPEENPTV